MTPLQAAEHLRRLFNLPVPNPETLTKTGKAIEVAVKFIEENCFEWMKIAGPETLPERFKDVELCYSENEDPSHYKYIEAHVYTAEGESFWSQHDGRDYIGFDDEWQTAIAWRPLPKHIPYQP